MKLEKQSTLCQETEEAVLNVKTGSNTSLQVKRDFMRQFDKMVYQKVDAEKLNTEVTQQIEIS